MQPEFATEILKGSLERGFHTAIETCGYVEWEILDKILPYLDLIYIDIKHMSSDKHQELTGVGNELILENIKRIDDALSPIRPLNVPYSFQGLYLAESGGPFRRTPQGYGEHNPFPSRSRSDRRLIHGF
jgi:c-di-GMP-related signal transduction protein